jgi:hypothetical protein
LDILLITGPSQTASTPHLILHRASQACISRSTRRIWPLAQWVCLFSSTPYLRVYGVWGNSEICCCCRGRLGQFRRSPLFPRSDENCPWRAGGRVRRKKMLWQRIEYSGRAPVQWRNPHQPDSTPFLTKPHSMPLKELAGVWGTLGHSGDVGYRRLERSMLNWGNLRNLCEESRHYGYPG